MGFEGIKMDNTKNTDDGKSESFIKRRASLMKKAWELATLCGSEVAVFGYSKDGELFEYASSSMAKILTRIEKCQRIQRGIIVNNDPEEDLLRGEMEKRKQDNDHHVLGMDLECMSREDLQELEQQLNEGLLCIKDRKEAILVKQLEQLRNHKQQCMQEIEDFRRKVESLELLCASTSYRQPLSVEYQMMAVSNFIPGQGVQGPQMTCNTSTGDENSTDLSLQLGPSTSKVCGKRKTPHEGTSNSDTFPALQTRRQFNFVI